MKTAIEILNDPNRFEQLSDGWIRDHAINKDWGPTSRKSINFKVAKKHCAFLGARLPEIKELQSLVDYQKYDQAIDKEAFKDTKSSWYWTNTPYAPDSGCAWCVSFYYGHVYNIRKDNTNYVRPVRDIESAQ